MILAGATSPFGDPTISVILGLLQVPVFGALVVAIIRGWIVTGKEHDRVVAERDREREERIKAQDALTDRVLPLLQETQHALTDAARTLDRIDDPLPRRRTGGR